MIFQLALGILVLIVLMLLTQNVAIGVLVVALVCFLLVVLILRNGVDDIEVSRVIDAQQMPSGTEFNVKLTITNNSATTAWLVVEDIVPEGLELLSASAGWRTALKGGQTQMFEYHCRSVRGLFRWQKTKVIQSDYFGVYLSTQWYNCETQLTVYPAWESAGHPVLAPKTLFGYAGVVSSKIPGAGHDFYGVRPYVKGDNLRQVHWRVSAKQGDLFVRDYLMQRNATVNVVVDARASVNQFAGQTHVFESSLSCAASVAEQCLRAGHKVALVIVGRQYVKIPAGVGRRHFKRILQALAEAKLGHDAGLEGFHGRFFKEFDYGSALFWISPLQEQDCIWLKQLRINGFNVVVLSASLLKQIEDGATEQVYRTEREMLLKGMRTSGTIVLDWPSEQPLASVMSQMQRMRQTA